MKVDFRMVQNRSSVSRNLASVSKKNEVSNFDVNSLRANNFSRVLTFTGNPTKNLSQVASIAPEYQGILDSAYKLGGLGNVAGEAAVSFQDKGKLDFRTFIPYYAPYNESGGIKVRTPIEKDGKTAFDYKSVPLDYKLKDGENFVIHELYDEHKPIEKAAYKILEDTGITGKVKTLNPSLDGLEETPYHVFSVKGTGVGLEKNPPVYVVHTPELAKFPKAYGTGGAYTAGNSTKGFDDLSYSIFSKSTIDAMPQLNNEKFGNFNPGNFWLHDRQAFPSLVEISEKSAMGDDYWKGIKAHSSYHNPGRDYQGHYRNPIDFLRIAGSKQDLEQLQKNPQDYEFVKEMVKKIELVRQNPADKRFSPEDILSKQEFEKLDEIFKPLFGAFVDETGEYNLCKIPVEGVKKNPFNFSAGTVSTNYGKEMKNHNTKEIAKGLTKDFASIPTIDIVNGSSATSLGLDVIGDFGKDNGFTPEVKAGFTPLTKEVTQSADTLFNVKQSNKKWLIDTIANATQKGQDALNHLIYSDSALNGGARALGGLSPYKDGDTLFISWGRANSQKGFTTTIESFLQFLKNEKIDPSKKEHVKFLIGSDPWKDEQNDWKTIQKQMDEIASLDNGKYKNNICFLNGRFTNRFVACADYSIITSRYEPCGITPLESFAGGTPVISNNTGGSPDFIKAYTKGAPITNETGFLTKNAYLVNPEVIGADKSLVGDALDEARRIELGKENADCIEQALGLMHNRVQDYKKMMMNALNSKIDWFENAQYNGGKSAMQRYKEEAWAIGTDNKELTGHARNMDSLVGLKGTIAQKLYADASQNFKEESLSFTGNISQAAKSTKNKYIAAIGVGIAAIGIGIGTFTTIKRKRNKPQVTPQESAVSSVKAMSAPSLQNFALSAKK